MKKLVLASQSPRRKNLLEKIGIPFTILPANIEESFADPIAPDEQVTVLSERKAYKAAGDLEGRERMNSIVLGADTMVVLDAHVLGKPVTREDAVRMLEMLSGKWHEVMTGVTLVDVLTGRKISHVEKTQVKIRSLSHETIKRYVDSGEPLDKAGAYGIQGFGAILVEKLDGCYYNVVGLPLYRVSLMLSELGCEIL